MTLKPQHIQPVIMAGIMAFLMTGVISWLNLGFPEGFFIIWAKNFIMVWPIASLAAFIAIPIAQRLTKSIIAALNGAK